MPSKQNWGGNMGCNAARNRKKAASKCLVRREIDIFYLYVLNRVACPRAGVPGVHGHTAPASPGTVFNCDVMRN
jgi:hypothetical protein